MGVAHFGQGRGGKGGRIGFWAEGSGEADRGDILTLSH
jgi:hypothetical protein